GLYDDGYVVAIQREAKRDTLWHIRAGRVTLATDAVERPIPFAGCNLPGVMLAGAVRVYLDRSGLLAGTRVAAFTPNDSTYGLADGTGPGRLELVGAAAAAAIPPRAPFWYVPADDYSTHFIDLQRDQTVQDVLDAVQGGLRSVEHVKRATYIGTAIDQGRTSG